MSEEKKDTVVTPADGNTAPAPAINLEMPSAPAPELSLDSGEGLSTTVSSPNASAAATKDLEERARLSPAEQKQVDEFAEKINIKDSGIILQYGAGAQKKMTSFSEGALNSVRSKDLGEVGNMLSGLVTQIKSFDVSEEEKKGLFGFFKQTSNKITAMKSRYATVETNVNQIANALEGHQVTLLKDIAMLDKMYEQNVVYFKELTMYILAGKKKLAEVENEELPKLRQRAKESGLPEDAQAVNDLANLCDRFAKKLYDLELTRTISIQMAPQIRLIQNSDTLMSEKIQSTLVNTIPLWKSQMVLALGLEHSQQAARAQREVTDMTNELLRKNSEKLKTATIETAKESERGLVDIETLQLTNQNLIQSLDEVVRIQAEGRQKRNAAEVELARIEGELKQKLLELHD
ncbi:toxic anion resistance protein [Ruminococcaceae bacterium OttesenSCG-928-I18]|nr:toxic anion resistance protein [Ruminococcaceae bacterium OttesenSCG-928-I18]